MKKKLFTSLILILLSFVSFAQSEKEPYVVISETTATFYYDDNKPEDALLMHQNNLHYYPWSRKMVERVVFNESFKDYEIEDCSHLFAGLSQLIEISGMNEYLNTTKVVNMDYMFYQCSSYKIINL